jgi:hypothetical protein
MLAKRKIRGLVFSLLALGSGFVGSTPTYGFYCMDCAPLGAHSECRQVTYQGGTGCKVVIDPLFGTIYCQRTGGGKIGPCPPITRSGLRPF